MARYRQHKQNPYRSVGLRYRLYARRPRRKAAPHLLRGHHPPPRFVYPALLGLLLLGLAALLLPPLSAATAGGALYYQTATALQPRLAQLQHYRPFQTTRLFDRHGTLLYEYIREGRRDYVPLAQIAPVLQDATIAIEDKTFWTNSGVDYRGIARAALRNAAQGAIVSGGSSITQQLVKRVLLTEAEQQQSYTRKVKEAILAQQLTAAYSKAEIFELYLNEIPYGNLAYGIQAAARTYFGVDAQALDLNQASLLAGLPQLPTLYNPMQYLDAQRRLPGVRLPRGWLVPENGLPEGISVPRARQVDVLRQMVLNGMVSEAEARAAIAQDLRFVEPRVTLRAPHFVFYVLQELQKDPQIGPLLTREGGLNITTTLDLRIQALAQREAKRRIEELTREGRNIHNAAVVVQQPGTGQLLAMVGSIDYQAVKATQTPGERGNVVDGNVNVTTQARQPGSALKPFTYLAALERGVLTPGSILWDVETRFPIRQGADDHNLNRCLPDPNAYWYCPRNYDRQWHGPMRMRAALANSLNMPAVLTLKRAEIAPTLDLLHSMGIKGLQRGAANYGLSLTLGGGEVTPLDLTTAYNTLANDGRYVAPQAVLQVSDRTGKVLRKFTPTPNKQVVDPKLVALVRDVLGDAEAREPMFGVNSPLQLSRPAHVKTGTTEEFEDAWAVGFTPYVTVGVWTGNNNNEPSAAVNSVEGGGLIWRRIMEGLFADAALDRFLREAPGKPLAFPPLERYGLVQRPVCQIGGPFGQRTREWFTPEMLKGETGAVHCDFIRTVQAVVAPDGGVCLPEAGIRYAAPSTTARVWNLPYSTEEEKIVGQAWQQFPVGATGGRGAVLPRACGPSPTLDQLGQPPSFQAPARPGTTAVRSDPTELSPAVGQPGQP
jgi:membrane peptidoglycan carboxypeptidase